MLLIIFTFIFSVLFVRPILSSIFLVRKAELLVPYSIYKLITATFQEVQFSELISVYCLRSLTIFITADV